MLMNKGHVDLSKTVKSSQSFEMAFLVLCDEMDSNSRQVDEKGPLSGTFAFGLLKQGKMHHNPPPGHIFYLGTAAKLVFPAKRQIFGTWGTDVFL